ncbi:DMT family transporter [Anaerotignum propionicum]
MVIFNKKCKHIIGLENSVLQLIISFLTVTVFILIKSGFALQISSNDWVWILTLDLFNTGIGCYFYFSSINNLPVQTVAICGYLEPLSAVIFSVIFLTENISHTQMLGAIMIIGGAILGEFFPLKTYISKIKVTRKLIKKYVLKTVSKLKILV